MSNNENNINQKVFEGMANQRNVYIIQFDYNKVKNKTTVKETIFTETNLNKIADSIFLDTSFLLENKSNKPLKLKEFNVKDDYNEQANIKDRAGTTLVNLLNVSGKIKEILTENINSQLSLKVVIDLYDKIEKCFEKYPIKKSKKVLEDLNELYFGTNEEDKIKIYNEILELLKNKKIKFFYSCKNNKYKIELKEKYKVTEFENLLKCVIEILSIKEEMFSEFDIFTLALMIFEYYLIPNKKELKNSICNCYWLLLARIKFLERNILDVILNKELKELVAIIFEHFYEDFEKIEECLEKNNFTDFEKKVYTRKQNNKCNTYFDKIYNYINETNITEYDTKTSKKIRYAKFSLKEFALLFVESILNEINYMLENFNNEDLKYDFDTNIRPSMLNTKEEKYNHKILCFNDLFFITKYYVSISGKKIRKCKVCSKFFVTEHGNQETCKRIYMNEKTCLDLSHNYSTYGDTIEKQIKAEIQKIKSMLRERNNLDLFSNDEIELNFKIENFGCTQEVLTWLEEKHEKLEKKNK